MLNQATHKNITRYHFLAEGECFTLLQLKSKLAEWGVRLNPDNNQSINYGWNLEDRDTPWSGEIPLVGSKFELYVSKFHDNVPALYDVVRMNHNLFKVVRSWN